MREEIMTDEEKKVKEENTTKESKGRSSEPPYCSTIPIWKCIWMYSGGSLVKLV
jgi:hypothetical protein